VTIEKELSMRSIKWLGLILTAVSTLFCGCGGGPSAVITPQPPSALSYTTATAVYIKGTAITPNSPTSSGGAVTAYSVNPALPAGLSLSTSTGIISGTPTAVTSTASYTVTASNSAGSTTATLTITVEDAAPAGLAYTTGTAVYTVGTAITPNSPTSTGGAVTAYSVSPALPAGLSLSPSTGIISGIPATATATASYTVTASNTTGSTTATLTITTAKIVPTEPAMDCANIYQLDLPNTQITTAELVSANSTLSTLYPGAGYLPEHCLVQGIVNPRLGVPAPAMDEYGNLTPTTASDPNYGISFELRMPTTTWNGDFFFTGGSGNDGVVSEAVGATLGGGTAFPPALYLGFAVITQNSGHTTPSTSDPNAPNQNDGFGYDPQARYDYGYQQTGTLTPVAKSILTSFYGISPVYSYYCGCSNGGREAMVASQRWGDMFDGIVAGDPGYRLPHAAIAEAWDTQQFAQAASAMGTTPDPNGNPNLFSAASQADLALVGQLVLQACDSLDGLQDKMIFNTAACKTAFNPATISQLQCTGAKTPTCLLPAQILAIQNVFEGPVDSQGNALYSNWPYDVGISDIKWLMWPIGLNPPLYLPMGYPQPVNFPLPLSAYPQTPAANITQGAQSAMYLFSTPPNPPPNPSTYVFNMSMDDLSNAITSTNSTFTQSAVDYMEATSTNLDTFTAHNGKIIFFHGESDPVFSMYDTVNYYENLSSKYGTATGSFARLFLVPGMNHCSGGSYALDSFDSLAAIVNWVEQGAAPDSIIAGNSFDQTSNPLSGSALPEGRTRPLCPYPQYAQYTGTGDSENAANFTCVTPAVGDEVAAKVKAIRRRQ
jgi:feruloyl esterase